ncbi:hypothetical protein ACRPOS_007290 [Bartonella heixiaziensis]|uniref:hypothetical protein n=1 Tax=Bartonella heixiaziensis TaxID=1461000 RepID=UPI003908AA4A
MCHLYTTPSKMETDRVGGWRLGCFRICAGNHLEGDFYLYTGDVGAAHSVGVSVEKKPSAIGRNNLAAR